MSSGESQIQPDTKVQVLNIDNNSVKKGTEGDSEDLLSRISNKKTNRKIPNIAEELAKNRNYVKGASPSPIIVSSSSPSASQSGPPSSSTNSIGVPTNRFSNNAAELCQHPQNPAISANKTNIEETRLNDKIMDNRNAPERGTSSFAASQLKISSLLTISSNDNSATSHINDVSAKKKTNASTTTNIPLAFTDSNMDANNVESLIKTPNSPRNKSLTPKVILPTQNMDGTLVKDPHLGDNTPGVLIAKTSSPVNLDVEGIAQPLAKFNKSSHSFKAALAKAPVEKVSLKRSNSSIGNCDSSINPSKKPAPERAKKSNSVSAILPKPVSRASKKTTSNNNDSNRKKNSSNKSASTTKKESSTSSKASTIKKENNSLACLKTTEKEKDKDGNGTDAKNSTASSRKDATSKSPRKLIPAPTVNPPKIIQTAQTKAKEPSILVDIPLYQADSNDYLDENGQIIFNLSTLIKEKYHPKNKELAQLKDSKRNLLTQLSDHSNATLEKEKYEEGEVIELDDDEDMEEDEGELDTETNATTATTSPKKKSHPMKGKNLIGKYDVEDPFIDDSELLWEEQRAATKDGFFVYFGPLIEKGHYASLERANGTMKRGGVKNK